MPDFRRKQDRLPRQSYIGRNWYFITACTKDRHPRFSDAALVGLLLNALRTKCRTHSMDVYAYCFMPDHLHLELVGLAEDSDLVKLTKEFKGEAASASRGVGIRNLWQKGFYDHVLREDDNADAVAWYIFNNPVRKGLAKDPRDWPYSGSWIFDWKKAVAPAEEFVPPWK
jgi:putative transposase